MMNNIGLGVLANNKPVENIYIQAHFHICENRICRIV